VPDVAYVASQFCIPPITYDSFSGILELTSGSYGSVARANWGPQDVVCKHFRGNPSEAATNACREIQNDAIGKSCPYVIAPIGYSVGPKNREPVLVYEFGGNTLCQLEEKWFSTRTAKLSLCHKLCEAVAGIHVAGIIHADLKGNNVLYQQGTAKLRIIDLGVALPVTAHIKNPKFGKEGYKRRYWQAPEFKTSKTLSVAIDAFAVGFLLCDLLVPLGRGKTWTVQPVVGLVADAFDKNIEAHVLRCFDKDPTSRPLLRVLAELFKYNKYAFP
jgi:serine/threonine protein kinase